MTFGEGFQFRVCCLVLFKLELELLDLSNHLLALGAIEQVPVLLHHELQMFDTLAANTQFIALRRQSLDLKLQLSFEPLNLSFLRSESGDQFLSLLLLGAQSRQQRVAVQRVQILRREIIHAASMPSITIDNVWKTRINTGESALSSHRNLRHPGALYSPPVNPLKQHRKLCSA